MAHSTPHTINNDVNPQTWRKHFKVAFFGSLKMIFYGVGGVVHAFFPEIKVLQFWTSSGIIRICLLLLRSRRHDDEFEKIFGTEVSAFMIGHRHKI